MILLVAALGAAAFPGRSGPRFPITIENCGIRQTFAAPPRRAIAMNQAASEVMLALGLAGRMVGTAYRDDEILPDLAPAYRTVPVLAAEYPSREVVLAAKPDFVYGSFPTAFGEPAAGPRSDLSRAAIASYLSPSACRTGRLSLETGFDEIRDLGRIFGVPDRADSLIAGYRAELARIRGAAESKPRPRIFWYDANDPPSAGACCGAPDLIIRLLGGRNVFGELPGAWATVSWEAVVARDPEAIVLVDAVWSPAADKRRLLEDTPGYARIRAVHDRRFATVPFSFGLPGIRTVAAVRRLAEQLWPDRLR